MPQISRLPVPSIPRRASARKIQNTQRRGSLLLFSSCTPHTRAFGRGVSSAPSSCGPRTASSSSSSSSSSSAPSSIEKGFRPSLIGAHRTSSSTSKVKGAEESKDMATPTTVAAAAEEQPKCEWLVILPDKPGVLDKRVSVRAQHIASISSAYPSDFWLVAGALLERAPHQVTAGEGGTAANPADAAAAAAAAEAAPPPPLPMQGSAGLVWASSADEIRRLLSGDVYAREGVWDMEKLQCWAFKSAVRRAW